MSKAAELAKSGDTLTNQPSGRKNIVINGGMQISQRATSSTGVGNASDESYGFELTLVKPSTTDTHKLVYGTLGGVNDDNHFTCILFGGMHHLSTAAVDRIRVIASSGNIDRGRFTLFGVANS